MAEKQKPLGWKDITVGAVVLKPGNAREYLTGGWRSQRPVWDPEKCTNCLMCWVYCPDSSILVAEQKMTGIDYDHCKGCGICAEVCPPKAGAIHMESE